MTRCRYWLCSDNDKKKRTIQGVVESLLSKVNPQSWAEPGAISPQNHHPIQNTKEVIGWHDHRSAATQNSRLYGTQEHRALVKKYLNKQFYLHTYSSLGTPCHVGFDVAPGLDQRIEYSTCTLFLFSDLQAIVLCQPRQLYPHMHQLLLAQPQDHYNLQFTASIDRVTTFPSDYYIPDCFCFQSFQWGSYLFFALIKETVNALVNHFRIDVYFRILLEVGIPPPGFEDCMIGEEINPPGPHEEPSYGYKKILHIDVPHPSVDLKSCFATSNVSALPAAGNDDANSQADESLEMKEEAYHNSQRLMAMRLKQRVEEGESCHITQYDIPQAADYVTHHAFSNAYQNEIALQHLLQVLETFRQLYMQEHPEYFQDFDALSLEAETYWMAHPEEYERCFPESEPRWSSQQSSPAGTPVWADDFGGDGNQHTYKNAYFDQDHAAVLNDPAVIHAVIRRRSVSK